MKTLSLIVLSLLAVASVARAADGVDWNKKMGAGGYVAFAHYPIADTEQDLTTQGVSFVYGVNGRLRLGANAGVFVSNRGGDTGGTTTGFSIAPTASYDLVQKAGGAFYVVTHSLAYDLIKNSGNNPDTWNLDILNAGLGLEAVVSNNVGVAFEGDVLRFGMTRALQHTETHVGALAFPQIRVAVRMYF